jgi:hypothetical protein
MSTPHDPVPEVPGLEEVIRALTAEGDATELIGRQSALTMFRATRDAAADFPPAGRETAPAQPWAARPALAPAAGHRELRRRGQPRPGPGRPAPRRRLSVLAATATAAAVACVGMTAAAYAQILPASVQNIAHSVLAPIGVPSASPGPTAIPVTSTPSSPSSPNATSPSPTRLPSAATSCPCRTAGPGAQMTLRLRAARAQVTFDGKDTFTGHVGEKGEPDTGVAVKLLEQLSTSPGTWDVVATGLTNATGDATFLVPQIPADAAFMLAGSGDIASLTSAEVAVTVTPRLEVRRPARHVLVVIGHGPVAGESVSLEQLQDGTWTTVATQPLDGLESATFTVASAGTYRFLLPAAATHDAAVSRQVVIGTTAAAVSSATPPATPQPTATATTTASATTAPKAKATHRVL